VSHPSQLHPRVSSRVQLTVSYSASSGVSTGRIATNSSQEKYPPKQDGAQEGVVYAVVAVKTNEVGKVDKVVVVSGSELATIVVSGSELKLVIGIAGVV